MLNVMFEVKAHFADDSKDARIESGSMEQCIVVFIPFCVWYL